ncbi:MAG: hypothetical protein J7642_21220 [Cyanobacteria bacterium SBC]|nr:hypothetical protein [Cyanobacteria bacterium SBC]
MAEAVGIGKATLSRFAGLKNDSITDVQLSALSRYLRQVGVDVEVEDCLELLDSDFRSLSDLRVGTPSSYTVSPDDAIAAAAKWTHDQKIRVAISLLQSCRREDEPSRSTIGLSRSERKRLKILFKKSIPSLEYLLDRGFAHGFLIQVSAALTWDFPASDLAALAPYLYRVECWSDDDVPALQEERLSNLDELLATLQSS